MRKEVRGASVLRGFCLFDVVQFHRLRDVPSHLPQWSSPPQSSLLLQRCSPEAATAAASFWQCITPLGIAMGTGSSILLSGSLQRCTLHWVFAPWDASRSQFLSWLSHALNCFRFCCFVSDLASSSLGKQWMVTHVSSSTQETDGVGSS